MKNKALFTFLTIGTALSIEACSFPFFSSNIEEAKTPLTESPSESNGLTEIQNQILDLIKEKSSGALSCNDYITLASLLSDEGLFLEARNTLEEAYKLFMDTSLIERLSKFTINLSEESKEKYDLASSLLSFMEHKDFSSVLGIFERDDLKDIFMQDICFGKRSFYISNENEVLLYLETGFDENDAFYSMAYSYSNNCFINVHGKNAVIQEIQDDGITITSILFSSDTVERKHCLLKDNLLDGDYSETVYSFDDYNNTLSKVYSSLDSLEGKEYKGTFKEGRVSLAEDIIEPVMNSEDEDFVNLPYAFYVENGKSFFRVKQLPKSDNMEYQFDNLFLGFYEKPECNPYEIKDSFLNELGPQNTANADNIVRVFNGNIQIFDGTTWYSIGSVEDFEANDPFNRYNDLLNSKEEVSIEEKDNSFADVNDVKTIEAIDNTVKEDEKPVSTIPVTKTPAAKTPVAQTPAAQTPAAQTPAAQTPATQAPTTPSVSEPSSEPDSQPSEPETPPPSPPEETPAITPSENPPSTPEDNTPGSAEEGSSGSNDNQEDDNSGGSDGDDVIWSDDLL